MGTSSRSRVVNGRWRYHGTLLIHLWPLSPCDRCGMAEACQTRIDEWSRLRLGKNYWRSKRAGPVCSESVRKWIFPIQKGEEPAELCMLISPRHGRHHGRAKNCWASANLACRIGLVWETHIRPHRWWCCGRPSSQKSQPPGDLPRPLEVRRATVDSVPHTGEPAPQASRHTRIAPCLYSFL
jgi:hypothetical protein